MVELSAHIETVEITNEYRNASCELHSCRCVQFAFHFIRPRVVVSAYGTPLAVRPHSFIITNPTDLVNFTS